MNARGAKLWPVLAALTLFAALSAANIVFFHDMNERNWSKSRSAADQRFNSLFTSLRGCSDFGFAIDAAQSPRGKLLGLGLYDRRYVENSDHDSVVILVQLSSAPPEVADTEVSRAVPGMAKVFRYARTAYLEMQQSWFWARMRVLVAMCVFVELLVVALVGLGWFFVRS